MTETTNKEQKAEITESKPLSAIKIPQHLKDLIGETVQYEIRSKVKMFVLSGVRWSTRFTFKDNDGNSYLAVELYLTENGKDYFWTQPQNTGIKNPLK